MLQHDDNGAQGVVLNKPLGAEVDSVLPGWGEHIAAPQTLFQGGPVQARLGARPRHGVQRRGPASGQPAPLRLGRDHRPRHPAAARHARGGRTADLRGVCRVVQRAGSSRRLDRGSWMVLDSLPGDLLTADPERLWEQVLLRQGNEIAFVAYYPSDPENQLTRGPGRRRLAG